MKLATGPTNWGVDFAETPTNPPWEQVLDEIAGSPLDALELGPVGYLPEDPEPLREALASRSLVAVGSFVF
ncbi:MAG: inosose dehydratase, partial [Solirubrobacterales bacterium]